MQQMVLLHVNAPASPGSRRLSGLLPKRTLLFAANARESGKSMIFRAGTAAKVRTVLLHASAREYPLP